MALRSLSPAHRRTAQAISDAAFVNPFSPEQKNRIQAVADLAASGETANAPFAEGLRRWISQLPEANFQRYAAADRELVRVATLYAVYQSFLPGLDELIASQMRSQDQICAAPQGKDCVGQLTGRGFDEAEAVRFFSIFYQLRRAHFFIVEGLRGGSACMAEFRRRLWTSVFTSDVRWYERYLWNRMEDFSTLLLGETGTGKGAAAAAVGRSGFIPYDLRRQQFAESFNRAFVPVNIAQFAETLVEAELFGYRKGAFTGAVQAHEGVFARCSPHGAIFLDEIGELSPHVQVKLLEVLQARTFSPVGSRDKRLFRGRVIAATNQPLHELRRERRFRDDLYYRISSDVITVPALRDRLRESSGELRLLLETILQRLTGADSPDLAAEVETKLRQSPGPDYGWPGNVRELEQAVRRVLLTGQYAGSATTSDSGEGLAEELANASLSADDLLARYCRLALARHGTRAEVARRLQLDPRTVQKYLGAS